MVAAGQRAVLVYAVCCIHRSIRLRRQYHIDATYAELAEQAKPAPASRLLPLFFSISELEISLQATHFRNAHS